MFVVNNILVSDDVAEATFCCQLGACRGGCCVQGEAGAPVEPEERFLLEKYLPAVKHMLRPEALKVIEEQGAWEEVDEDEYVTTCVNGAECVFVTYDGPVAKCALQKAHADGVIDWPKPISCHLYPIRVEKQGPYDVLNYERIELCDPGREHGSALNLPLANFLGDPLSRKFGSDWYAEFLTACAKRRRELSTDDRF